MRVQKEKLSSDLSWPTKPVGHVCHRSVWNPWFWVWVPSEHGFRHRASLSQWGTEQNLHTIRENRFRLCSSITVPAGNTQSSTPADRLMATLNPAVPQPISGLDLNRQVSAGKQSRSISLLYRNAVSQGRPSLTDCNLLRQQQLNKWKMSCTSLSAPPLIFSRAEIIIAL